MRFDFSQVDWRFVSRILHENSDRLSRTRKGLNDCGKPARKLPLLLSGPALIRRCRRNEQNVHRYIFRARQDPPPLSGLAVLNRLFDIAAITCEGLLPRGWLRTWPVQADRRPARRGQPFFPPHPKLPPHELPGALADFCAQVHRRWGELNDDPVPLAAWTEWQLSLGPLHPFYDGCGRIARTFSALLLMCGQSLPPLYDDVASYYRYGNASLDEFIRYMRRCIRRCAHWVNVPVMV